LTEITILGIDSGTTNTRVFVIKNKSIIGKGYAAVGARNTAMTGNTAQLRKGIKTAVRVALKKANLQMHQIDIIAASVRRFLK